MVRIKNRYLLVNILYPDLHEKTGNSKVPDIVVFNQPTTDILTPQALLKGIRLEIASLFGDFGSGAVAESLSIKYISNATSSFILRVSRSHYKLAWAALSFMTNIPLKNGRNCVFRVIRVSGTIRKAEEEAIRRARALILGARREVAGKGESAIDSIFGETAVSERDVLMAGTNDSDMDDEDIGASENE